MGTVGERAGGRPQAARGGPDPRRLQAAVKVVVERMRPGQIILFGSGARGEMSEGSDLDLLAIAGGGGGAAYAHERWRCEMIRVTTRSTGPRRHAPSKATARPSPAGAPRARGR